MHKTLYNISREGRCPLAHACGCPCSWRHKRLAQRQTSLEKNTSAAHEIKREDPSTLAPATRGVCPPTLAVGVGGDGRAGRSSILTRHVTRCRSVNEQIKPNQMMLWIGDDVVVITTCRADSIVPRGHAHVVSRVVDSRAYRSWRRKNSETRDTVSC